MLVWQKWLFLCVMAVFLSGCSSSKSPQKRKTTTTVSKIAPVRITHLQQQQASSELMLHSMSLVGTPYRFGGTSRTGFDCSGMVQYVYKTALGVALPRTARDMASAGIRIKKDRLKIGDLVFFNTNGKRHSHVGLYIGNGQFIHSPSSNGVIRTNLLSDKYYAQHFDGAVTYFIK